MPSLPLPAFAVAFLVILPFSGCQTSTPDPKPPSREASSGDQAKVSPPETTGSSQTFALDPTSTGHCYFVIADPVPHGDLSFARAFLHARNVMKQVVEYQLPTLDILYYPYSGSVEASADQWVWMVFVDKWEMGPDGRTRFSLRSSLDINGQVVDFGEVEAASVATGEPSGMSPLYQIRVYQDSARQAFEELARRFSKRIDLASGGAASM